MTTTEKNNYLEALEDAELSIFNYDYDNALSKIMEIGNETGNEDLLYDIIDIETAEDLAKREIDRGGLYRLYYFMNDVNFNSCGEYLRINGYGNLKEIDKSYLECLASDLRDRIESL